MRVPVLLAALAPCVLVPGAVRGEGEPFESVRDRFDAAARGGEASVCRSLAMLTAAGHPDGVPVIARAIHDRPTPGVWAHATDALARLSSEEALARVRTVAASGGVVERTAAILSLAGNDGAPARAILADALVDRNAAVRAAAVLALAGSPRGPAAAEALVEALSDAAWQVRAAAVRAAGERRLQAAVPALVRMLEMERPRLASDAEQSLRAITGLDLGREAGPWERWLATREAPPKGDIAYTVPTWYGVPVVGERPVFVLDVSGSMEKAVIVSDADRRRLAAKGEFATKLDLAREEMLAVLGRLPRSARFGLVVYADEAKAWRTSLTAASPDSVRSAGGAVSRIGAGGMTNIYDALLLAMDPSGKDAFAEREAEAPDQVLFLTDGVPSAGLFRDEASIRRVACAVARLRGVRIDCVAIATGQTAFLRDLAEATGGTCVSVGR